MRKKVISSVLVVSFLLNTLVSFGTITKAATKEELEKELQEIERQIQEYQKELSTTKNQKQTLNNKIKELKNTQNQLNLAIRSTTLQIDNLGIALDETKGTIESTNNQIQSTNNQIGEVVRQLYEKDKQSLIEMFLSDGSIEGAFEEIGNYQNLSKELSQALAQSKNLKAQLEQQANKLAEQEDEAKGLLNIQSLQKQELNTKLGEQDQLLKQTKGKEDAYQALLTNSQKKAAEIRGRIYDLVGVGKSVTFGEALAYAQEVSGKTGVRAAFLLAILTQETNLGRNVGTCNRAGDPPSKSWRVVMKPTRDQQPFIEITDSLGLDIDTTPVSCPMRDSKGNQVGWGGGMGPAQFIPSTWMGYKDKVAAMTGKTANPWNIRDAFYAAAIKLKNDGALNGESGEWSAAMRYFSGSTNTRFRFYGDNVMALTKKYQQDIDTLAQ